MGRILFTRKNEKGDINYIAGKVSFVRDGQDGKVVNIGITINEYDTATKVRVRKYVSLAGWNDDDLNKAQMADRLRKAKVATGSYILARCGTLTEDEPAKDGTPRLNSVLFDFQYNAFQAFEDNNGNKRSIIIGTVRKIKDSNNEYFEVGIPVETTKDGKKETKWYNISFRNTEKSAMADTARKIIKVGSAIAVYGSEVTTKAGKNGNEFNDMYGYVIDVKYDNLEIV
jgi:hypothetical protein